MDELNEFLAPATSDERRADIFFGDPIVASRIARAVAGTDSDAARAVKEFMLDPEKYVSHLRDATQKDIDAMVNYLSEVATAA